MSTDGHHTERLESLNGSSVAPPSASRRGYLRAGLPSVYLEGDFGMRFIGALETVLDPIVDTLDSLPAYVSPELAPDHMLKLLAAWLGLVTDEGLPPGPRRDLVRNAAEVSRRRSTAAGLELLLKLTFPEVRLHVEDGGRVVACDGVATLPTPPVPSFVVRSETALTPDQRAAIVRMLERQRPVHVTYRLEESGSDAPVPSPEVIA
jgi:phage tail-like protein